MKYLGRITLVSAVLLLLLCSYIPTGMSYSSSVTATGTINCTFNDGEDVINNNETDKTKYSYTSDEDKDKKETTDTIVATSSGQTTDDLSKPFDITVKPRSEYFYLKVNFVAPGNNSGGEMAVELVLSNGSTIRVAAVNAKTVQDVTFFIRMVDTGATDASGNKIYDVSKSNTAANHNVINEWISKGTISAIHLVGTQTKSNCPTVHISVVYRDI